MMPDVAEVDTLHLIHVPIDQRKLAVFADAQGLVLDGEMDEGYVVHALLKALFGDAAPKPFVVRRAAGGIAVVGYATQSAEALSDMAALVAEPAAHGVVDWERVIGKRMPPRFVGGMRVGFDVRACPTVRIGKPLGDRDPGSEIDVAEMALERWAEGDDGMPKPSRDEIYRGWIARELGRAGAARLISFSLEGFQIRRIMRKTHDEARRCRWSAKPDATMFGTMEITDAGTFGTLLKRGVGRHRSFGYGALLLRPPASAVVDARG